jgi:hypothetical protein
LRWRLAIWLTDVGIPELLPDPEDEKAKGNPIINNIQEQEQYVNLVVILADS